jgi:hypothetical protein
LWIIGAWLELPVWQQLLVLTGCYATSLIVIHCLAFHSPAREWVRSFRGVVAPFFVSVAVIFGLLLGFVAGDVWHRNAEAVRIVRGEGDALFQINHLALDSDPGSATLRDLIRAYALSVVVNEWPLMQRGQRSDRSEAALDGLIKGIVTAPVFASGGLVVQRARLDLALKLHTLRENRIELAGDRTDEIRWAALLLLALLTQVAIAATHLEVPRPQIAALTIFSIAAVVGLGLIAIQERPFSSPVAVSPSPLEDVVHEIPAG